MKLYEIVIKPKSAFYTSLQGDTIFGNLCWQIENAGFNLPDLLSDYAEKPFMIVSSAFYKNDKGGYLFNRPLLPSHFLFPDQTAANRKENDDKKNFIYDGSNTLKLNGLNWYNDFTPVKRTNAQHNTINRQTGTTGEGEFAPFSQEVYFFDESVNLVIFAAIDESRFSKEKLEIIFENLGKTGYGKKASIGYGQFEVLEVKESVILREAAEAIKNSGKYNSLYALSPFVPSEDNKRDYKIYFDPITKYGKHGAGLAKSSNPFKKPVIMANTASVLSFQNASAEKFPLYVGAAVKNVSDANPETVVQGYSLVLPCYLEVK
ncbi:MAG: hypothetical protein FWF00_01180 [Endomicrobia bacterium]|nr:hypothetical protein [Endomicrobiia bacterium]MCL2506287.1 hypothetical protein [Endomicrobiia bacterium]